MKILLSTLLTILLFFTTQASAWDSGEGDGARPGDRHKGILKQLQSLDLSPEQLEKIKSIKKEFKGSKNGKHEKKAHRAEMKALKIEMSEALKGSASKSQILAIADKIDAKRTAKQRARLEKMLEIREILTPEQRSQIDFMPGKRKHR